MAIDSFRDKNPAPPPGGAESERLAAAEKSGVVAELKHSVDQLLRARYLIGKGFIDWAGSLDKDRSIDLIHFGTRLPNHVDEILIKSCGMLIDECLSLLGCLDDDLPDLIGQVVEAAPSSQIGGGVDMAREGEIILHFLEALTGNLRQRILLAIHHAGLQGHEHFGKRHWRGFGAILLKHAHAPYALRHPPLDTAQVFGGIDGAAVIGDMAETIFPNGENPIAILFR